MINSFKYTHFNPQTYNMYAFLIFKFIIPRTKLCMNKLNSLTYRKIKKKIQFLELRIKKSTKNNWGMKTMENPKVNEPKLAINKLYQQDKIEKIW